MNDLNLEFKQVIDTKVSPTQTLANLLLSSKNLLAFSAGVDSSALFYLLYNANIPFDIAIINYNLREQSKDEVEYAKSLAKKYNKNIFIKSFDNKEDNKFNQNMGREFRYDFFNHIIKEHSYNNLILAHQLDDKLEWFLMQLSKGAGVYESTNINILTPTHYGNIIRPLLQVPKACLQEYLTSNNLTYFVDESNHSDKYTRNYFRKHFNSFLFAKQYANGINKSFEYFNNDFSSLINTAQAVIEHKSSDGDIVVYKKFDDFNLNIKIIDKELKKRGIIISAKTKNEIIKQQSIVIKDTISVSIDGNYIWICPSIKDICMDKKFKELCRLNNIPQNARAFLYKHKHIATKVISLLSDI